MKITKKEIEKIDQADKVVIEKIKSNDK